MADQVELKAIITAVDKLSAPLKGMRREVKTFKQEFRAGMVGAAALGAGVMTAMAGPIKQAIDFESTMADVRKVVEFETPEQFKKMSQDILALSHRLPMAAEGIGQIVAAGGQANIAKNELLAFAGAAVKMGVAFDQSAAQAGQMMATWRTAFRLTQNEVVSLADKINDLGNHGPANAAKISDIVTRIGPLGAVAGMASGEMAALGATIGGMGVEADVTATGIKKLMLALTSGKSATLLQKKALRFLNINPSQLAVEMQKDAKGALLKVLDTLSQVPKAKQSAVMKALFGSESLGAIAPLLSNLERLKVNFDRVADVQKYAGSMQKEYAARAATTANAIQLFKNQIYVASVTIGSIFLPAITRTLNRVRPLIEQCRHWIKAHPELIKSLAQWGVYLLGTATAVGVVTRAFKIFNSVMNMSTLGKLVTLMVIGGGLIVDNWETIGPMIKAVWRNIDGVIQAIGGWETGFKSVAALTAGSWLLSMGKGLSGAQAQVMKLSKSLKGMASMGVVTVTIAVLFDWMKRLDTLRDEAARQHTNVGTLLVNRLQEAEQARGYTGFLPRLKELLNIEGRPPAQLSLASPGPQPGELTVSFQNAPPGMTVQPATQSPVWLNYDVGYNRFARR